jgi:hypothetical protein
MVRPCKVDLMVSSTYLMAKKGSPNVPALGTASSGPCQDLGRLRLGDAVGGVLHEAFMYKINLDSCLQSYRRCHSP